MRTETIQSIAILFAATVLLSACGDGLPEPDAYGTFEATEVLVSAETQGRLLSFTPRQGDRVELDGRVAEVETTQLVLRLQQLNAARSGVASRMQGVEAEANVLAEQRRVAARELDRIEQMLADSAATEQARDETAGRIAVLQRQIESARTQTAPIAAEVASIDAQIAQVEDQIRRALIQNPAAGTVLATYAETGEVVAPGSPLYRVADLSRMTLRAYVEARQLARVSVGQRVAVRFDDTAGGLEQREGVLTWIASEAQFTPRHIQTRDERTNLVYAVKVRVDNGDGQIRIGMPGELYFDR